MNITKEQLVNLLNEAINYGGDLGGPYFTDCPTQHYGKSELIKIAKDAGLEIIFDEHDSWIKNIHDLNYWSNYLKGDDEA